MKIIDKINNIIRILIFNIHKRRQVVLALSCVVVFVTTYILILPAFTLEKDKAAEQGGIDIPEAALTSEMDEESDSSDPLTDAQADENDSAAESDYEPEVINEPDAYEQHGEATDEPESTVVKEDPQYARTMTYEGDGFTITVEDTYSVLPDDAEVVVDEIIEDPEEGTEEERKAMEEAYQFYCEQAISAINDQSEDRSIKTISFARMYDISFMSSGEEITPDKPVNVTITYDKDAQNDLKIDQTENVHIVHFAQDEKTEDVTAELIDEESVDVTLEKKNLSETTFEAESFSVYAVIYTVDFHYEVNGKEYDLSIPGGGFISFNDLVDDLGIADDDPPEEFVRDVESIAFSSPELMSVSKVDEKTTVGAIKEALGLECEYSADLSDEEIAEINDRTVEADDWALISLKPFDTEESLTVTMINGDQFVIKVTDARVGNELNGRSFMIQTQGDEPLSMSSNDPYNYGDKRFFRASEPTGNNDQIWIFEYDGRYDNTYHIKSASTGQYIRLDPNNDDGFTFTPNDADQATLFWIDYDSNTDTYEINTNSPAHNFSYLVYLNTLYDNNSPRFTMGNSSQRFKFVETEVKDETALMGDWLLFLDEDQDEIYVRVGETISLRPFDEWTWKEAAIQNDHWNFPGDSNAPTNWYIASNADNESSKSSWTSSNGVFTFNRHIKYDDQLEVRYWSVQGKANQVGDYVLTNTRNGHQITVHVIPADDEYHKLTPFTGPVPIKVNLFDYDKGKRLDPENNSNTETRIINQSVNIGHDLHFLSSGNGNGGINRYTKDNNNPGIVATTLDSEGYPVLASGSGESLKYLFDTSKTSWTGGNYNDGMIAYPGVTGLFQQDQNGYYYYNSNSNYAYYDAASNSMLLYPHTYTQTNKNSKLFNSKPIGFFPFHAYESANPDHLWVNQNQYLNHHIGMSMEIDFEITENRLTERDQHIVYEFSGDDDLWVFVDDELVLDIGGVHQPLGGKIDFTEGKIYVYNASGTAVTTKTFDVGAHKLSMFYLERGGCDSNLSLKMNMPLILGVGDLELYKSGNTSHDGLPGAVFGIWDDPNCEGDPYAIAESDGNGIVFKSLPVRVEGQKYYIREMLAPQGFALDDTIYIATAGTYDAAAGKYPFHITALTEDGESEPSTYNVGGKPLPEVVDTPAAPIDLSVQKLWQDASGAEISAPSGASVKFVLKRTRTYNDSPVYTVNLVRDNSNPSWNPTTLPGGQCDTITAHEGDVLTISYVHSRDNNGYAPYCNAGNGATNILQVPTSRNVEEIRVQYTVNSAHAYSNRVIDILIPDGFLDWCDPSRNQAFNYPHFVDISGSNADISIKTEQDAEFNNQARSVTLPTGQGGWTGTFSNLPVQEVKNGIIYQYRYYVEEDASGSNIPADFETVYTDQTGNHPISGSHSQETATTGTQKVINQKLIDIPVSKIWPDFENNHDGATYDWEVDLQLDYRDVPVDGEGEPTDWREYKPDNTAYQKKLTKSGPENLFEGLPMYVYDDTGRKFKREYSVVEKGYKVWENGNLIASHIDNVYTPSDKRYALWYEHDAGEESTDPESYYISVYNMHENRDIEEDITIDINKVWKNTDGSNITPSNEYKAKFTLKRNILVEYRNHEDVTLDKSNWVTVNLVTGSDADDVKTLIVPPGTSMYIRGILKDGAPPSGIKFTRSDTDEQLTAVADSQFSEQGYNLFMVPFTAPESNGAVVDIVMDNNSDIPVVGGAKGFMLSDSSDRQFLGEDQTFIREFELSNANGWSKHFPDTTGSASEVDDLLPVVEVSELDADGKTANTYIYTYYFEEVECTPDDFYASFTDNRGNVLGDENHEIYTDSVITATNRLKPGSLRIKKNVTVNGEPLEATDPNTQFVDGTYTFRIEGVEGTDTENIVPRTATINISRGRSDTVEVRDLAPGQYRVTELMSPNGASLVGENGIVVTVEMDVTGDAAPLVEMTNDRQLTELKVKKEWAATSPSDHPTNVTFRLYRVGYYMDGDDQRPASEGYYPDNDTIYTIYGSAETVVSDLPVNGVESVSGINRAVTYEYRVVEMPVSGDTDYWPSYSTEGDVTTITNTPVDTPDHETDISVSKSWLDKTGEDASDDHENDQIEFTLKAIPHNTGYVPVHLVYVNADNTTWKQEEVFVKKNEKLNFVFRKGGTIANHQIVITEGSRQTTTGGNGTQYGYESNAITDEVTITLSQTFVYRGLFNTYYDRWGDTVENLLFAYQWTSAVTATGGTLYTDYDSFFTAMDSAEAGEANEYHYTLGKDEITGQADTYEGEMTGEWSAIFEDLPEFQKIGNDYYIMTYEISELKIIPYGMSEEPVGESTVAGYQGESENYLINWTQNGDSWTITNREKPGLDVIIRKTDDDGTELGGAVFEIYKQNGTVFTKVSHNTYDWLDDNDQFTVPEEGFMLAGLKDGLYQIREVTPPEGYVILNDTPVTFEIEHGAIVSASNILADGVGFKPASGSVKDAYIIPNSFAAELPHTGGIGTTIFYILGSILVIGCGVYLISRRRVGNR